MSIQIKIPAEDMNNVGKAYVNKSEEYKKMMKLLNNNIQYVLNNSEGEFKKVADSAKENINSNMIKAIESFEFLGKWCTETANKFDFVDNEIARKGPK